MLEWLILPSYFEIDAPKADLWGRVVDKWRAQGFDVRMGNDGEPVFYCWHYISQKDGVLTITLFNSIAETPDYAIPPDIESA